MRIRLLALSFAALLCLAGQAWAEGLTKIAENVYSYVDVKDASPKNSFAANAGIVIGQNGVLAVDSLISAKQAKKFIEDIRKVTDKPIKYLVNTHYHLDHALGNSEFRKLGAAIICQVQDAKSLAERGPAMMGPGAAKYGLSEEDMAGTEIAVPDITFTDRMTIDLGGEIVELIYPGPSHTAGSIFVNVPARKVVFAGDALFTDFHPFLAEGDFPSWAKALDTLNSLGAQTIIPGHGPASGPKDVADMKAYLVLFDTKAKEFAAQGADVETVVAKLKEILPQKSRGEMLITGNVALRYVVKK